MLNYARIPDDFLLSGDGAGEGIHALHPYPAKFPAKLARENLANYARPGDVVMDPFCGSGTTLVEAKRFGLDAVGVDVNDLACLISKVKTTPLESSDFRAIERALANIRSGRNTRHQNIVSVNFNNCEHWFQKNVVREISALLEEIKRVSRVAAVNFLKMTLASIVVRVSNQESDTRYAAVDKNIEDGYTVKLFVKKAEGNIKNMQTFFAHAPSTNTVIYRADSRDLSFIAPSSIDCVVTSPPYANSYDYYLYHKFRCIWLNLDFRFAQNKEIGSRREFSSLKRCAMKWRADLSACFFQINRAIKKGGIVVMVIGDSVIAGKKIDAGVLVSELAKKEGFKIKSISSYSQAKNSKSFNPMFSAKNKQEHVVCMVKK